MAELKWTAKIVKEMRACGAIVLPIVGGANSVNGAPDRIVVHGAWRAPVFMEFKDETTELSRMQRKMMHNINWAASRSAFVIRAPDRIEMHINTGVVHDWGFEGTGRNLIDMITWIKAYKDE